MNISYQKWFTIQLLHSYFKNGLCPVAVLEPFAETAQLMKNYQLLLRHSGDGLFTIYVGSENQDDNVFADLTTIGPLYFQLLIEDIIFFKYTALPQMTNSEMILLSNTTEWSYLHKNAEVSVEDIVTVRQDHLFELDTIEENDILEITNETGSETIQKSHLGITLAENENGIPPVNARTLKTGKYQSWRNDTPVGDPYYHFNTEISSECLGMLAIDPAQLQHPIDENNTLSAAFAVRNVYRKYKIVSASNSNKIILGGISEQITPAQAEDTAFSSYTMLGEELLVGAQKAQVFISPKPAALVQYLDHHPELTYSYTDHESNTQTAKLKLPNPSPEHLEEYITAAGVKALCTTTIVYV